MRWRRIRRGPPRFLAGSATPPASIAPGEERIVSLLVAGDAPGPVGLRGVAIDYRAGPFSFRVVARTAYEGCLGPPTDGVTCPE